MEKIVYNIDKINEIAQLLLQQQQHKAFCFYGPMGAGKTTLIKALVEALGAVDSGNSPTFGLVNRYENAEGILLAHHFDFYRIEHEVEVLDMGIEDYFASEAHIFIEWPEKIPNLLLEDHLKVNLQFIDETTRSIEF
ncbi:MAG: tRNA (adenosine(37)-N6)-threonylcarbamoyltransferase complex ATPase subunit type 1 TsaE [Allomuricauda sp.]|nr:MAG: tRNA (adenosine(37)-N6)-threonylcarbamoyltransferase complex ATPase subunit type 1 TsaE [Allomuricauda sp.]